MKKIVPILLFPILLLPFSIVGQNKVVAYVTSYSALDVTTIQYDKLTHINYAFVTSNTNGTISSMPNASYLNSLVTYSHANDVKVFISIGGWGNQSKFDAFTANASYRKVFVNAAVALVNTYNLDGVDIDWEYPQPGTTGPNCTLLMFALSDTLHKINKGVTMAVVDHGTTAGGIEDAVFDYVDFLNIMAYDAGTPHSTYNEGKTSLDYWVQTRSLDPAKALLGLPFYGKDAGNNSLTYANIVSLDPVNAPNLDYITNGTVYWYNGIPTIKAKTTYAKANGGGVMIWELSQDVSGSNSLLLAISQVMPAQRTTPVLAAQSNVSLIRVYPNPCNASINIPFDKLGNSQAKIEIFNSSGKLVSSQVSGVISADLSIATEGLNPGMYYIKIMAGETILSAKFVKE